MRKRLAGSFKSVIPEGAGWGKEVSFRFLSVLLALLLASSATGLLLLLPLSQRAYAEPGNQVRTVEYALGQRFDSNPLGPDIPWAPGNTEIYLPEAGVTVVSAWVELHVQAPASLPGEVNSVSIVLNGQEISPVNGRYTTGSGESCILWVCADATPLFSGISHSLTLQPGVTIHGANSQGHSLKLFITYLYDDSSPIQLKTIRYPLASKNAATLPGNTASFAYNARMPESGVTIRSLWFEVTGQASNEGNTTDSFLYADIGGAGATPNAYVEMQEMDSMDIRFLFQPSGFLPDTPQTFNLTVGGQSFYLLGGELVITYEFDANSVEQCKTVSYFMGQSQGGETAAVTFSQTLYLPENGITVRDLWLHLRANASSSLTHRVRGFVAGTAVGQINYSVTASMENIGEHRIIYSMTSQAVRAINGVVLRGDTWYNSANGGPCGMEAWVTYTYNTNSSIQIKSVSFLTGQSGDGLNSSSSQFFATVLPESGAHTRRSAYLVSYIVSSAQANYLHTVDINGSNPSSVTMRNTGEANTSSRLYEATQISAVSGSYTANYSSGNNAGWNGRATITYEIELPGPPPSPRAEIKTVEYYAGQRLDSSNLAAGNAWTPPPTTVYFPEEGVRVRSAWLEFRAQAPSDRASNVTSIVFEVNGLVFPTITNIGFSQTGESGIVWTKSNITSLFSSPTNTMVVSPSITVNGADSQGHSLKLVITYECLPSSATVMKTVRYPLASSISPIAAGGTASYPYNAIIPESGFIIRSQWFEVKGQAHNGWNRVDSYLYANIDGGVNTSGAYVEMNLQDSMDVCFLFQPPGFQPNTDQTLNVVAGGQAFYVLGGELVVTYSCDGFAPVQLKTVDYYMGASNASTSPLNFTQSIYLPESSISVKHVWAQVRGNTSANISQSVSGSIGGSPLPQRNYSLTANVENIGEHRIIYDMSSQSGALGNGTPVTVSTWYSAAGGGAVGVELMVTYTFDNEHSPSQIKTVQYWVGQSNNASVPLGTFRFYIWMPEEGKNRRSSYLESYIVSRAVAGYTHGLDIDGSNPSTLTMANTGEASSSSRLYEASQVGMASGQYTCNASSGSEASWSIKAFVTYEYNTPTVFLVIDSMYDIDGNPSQFGEMHFGEVDPFVGTYIIGDDEPYAIRLQVTSSTTWRLVVQATGDLSDGIHTIPIGQLSFSPHGSGSWAPFSTGGVTVAEEPATGPGGRKVDLDYRLTVDWDDEPGSYAATLVYTLISL